MIAWSFRRKLYLSCFLLGLLVQICDAESPTPTYPTALSASLEAIRAKYGFPALAGAIVTADGIAEQAAVGVRKRGTDVSVGASDKWSLGSDSKAFTALLVGTYVADGRLKWSTPIVSYFPELTAQIPVANRAITIGDVLSHSAGLKDDLDWYALSKQGAVDQQRQTAAREALLAPEYPPGTFHYSNAGYVLIAALLERMTGQTWEKLMTERIFKPLHMDSAGFYRAASLGKIDQPWPHLGTGKPVSPTDFSSTKLVLGQDELPHVLAPAGLIHCSMTDWAKFLSDQLRGAAGLPALLPTPIYQAMQTARPGSPNAYGWGVADRPWAGGKILEHEGSDGMNYCICLLAPSKKFGVLVCTNQGGDQAQGMCYEMITLLVNRAVIAKSP